MPKFGQWNRLRDVMRGFDRRLRANCRVALMRAGVVLEVRHRLRSLAADGAAQFLGRAALHPGVDPRDRPRPLLEGFREQDRRGAAVGVVEEDDALGADEHLADL